MSETTVTVRRRMRAPAAALFEVLTDPTRFARVRGISSVDILLPGSEGPSSVGTVRRVNLTVGYLVEEFLDLQRPTRFDYRIRAATVPFEHRFGRIEFLERGDHTEGVWTSTVGFAVPVIGAGLALGANITCRVAFAAALREMDRVACAQTA